MHMRKLDIDELPMSPEETTKIHLTGVLTRQAPKMPSSSCKWRSRAIKCSIILPSKLNAYACNFEEELPADISAISRNAEWEDHTTAKCHESKESCKYAPAQVVMCDKGFIRSFEHNVITLLTADEKEGFPQQTTAVVELESPVEILQGRRSSLDRVGGTLKTPWKKEDGKVEWQKAPGNCSRRRMNILLWQDAALGQGMMWWNSHKKTEIVLGGRHS